LATHEYYTHNSRVFYEYINKFEEEDFDQEEEEIKSSLIPKYPKRKKESGWMPKRVI
jgi:hypothetical protein